MSKLTIVISIAIGMILLTGAGGLLYWMGGNSPQSQLSRARMLSEEDKLDALDLVHSSIQAPKGEFAEAQLFECQLLLDVKRGKEADRVFAAIRHPESIDPETLCRLAEKAQSIGAETLASRAYLAAGEFVLSNPLHMKRLIYALYRQHDQNYEDRILKLCQEYSQRWPDDAYPWIMSAGLYSERNVPSLAVTSLREALKRESPPEKKNLFRITLAQLSLILGDIRAAREQCDVLQAAALDENSQQLLPSLLAEVLLRERKPAEALKVLEKLPDARSASAEIWALRGRCRFALEDFEGAISELTEALRLNDFDQQSHYILGQAYLRMNIEPLANRHLNRSRELNEITAQIFTLENQLRNDLSNRQLKLQLAELNERRGNREKAAAWRRGAAVNSRP